MSRTACGSGLLRSLWLEVSAGLLDQAAEDSSEVVIE
jgi:hypothetical protein